jgi:hypothetical protein
VKWTCGRKPVAVVRAAAATPQRRQDRRITKTTTTTARHVPVVIKALVSVDKRHPTDALNAVSNNTATKVI